MDIRQYLDSTYLRTPEQAGLTLSQINEIIEKLTLEAIRERFKLVMVSPDKLPLARQLITEAASSLLVGTVIDFPLGRNTTSVKLIEAEQAIVNGADELDFVLDYKTFKEGKVAEVKEQVLKCTTFALENKKTVKWIIEVAALEDHQIVQLSALVKNVVMSNFEEGDYSNVFVKSSTGVYQTENGKPNGATLRSIQLMIENSFPLPVKASGGVRTYEEAVALIAMGVKRIGTSSAKAIAGPQAPYGSY